MSGYYTFRRLNCIKNILKNYSHLCKYLKKELSGNSNKTYIQGIHFGSRQIIILGVKTNN